MSTAVTALASSYQYRITVNGTEGSVFDIQPSEQWSRVAQVIEDRGGKATLERRYIDRGGDFEWLDGVKDEQGNLPSGWMVMGGMIVSSWNVLAEVESR